MDKFSRLKELVSSIEEDVERFYQKNNKAAGTRVRKTMQEVKTLAQELRMDILNGNKKAK